MSGKIQNIVPDNQIKLLCEIFLLSFSYQLHVSH